MLIGIGLMSVGGQGGGGATPQVTYLWRATFDDVDAAPLATPRAEAVGESIVVQAESLFATDGSALVVSGQAASNNYITPSTAGVQRVFTFTPGRTFQTQVNWTAGGFWMWAFGTLTGGQLLNRTAFQVESGTKLNVSEQDAGSIENIVTSSISRTYALILRENGGFFAVDVTNEKLLWVSKDRTQTNRRAVMSTSTVQTYTVNIPEASVYDMPTGNPFLTEYGIATSRIAAPAAGESSTMEANALLEITWTAQTNEVLTWLFRRTDDDNTLKLVCDQSGGTIKLYRRSGGVDTEMDAGKTQVWTNGSPYRLTVQLDGTSIVTRVSGVRKQNATTTVQQNATGLLAPTSNLTPNISNLVAWRGGLPGFPFV